MQLENPVSWLNVVVKMTLKRISSLCLELPYADIETHSENLTATVNMHDSIVQWKGHGSDFYSRNTIY